MTISEDDDGRCPTALVSEEHLLSLLLGAGHRKEDQWEFFPDRSGKWRWLKTNADGITVASSPRGYRNVEDCMEDAMACGCAQKINILYIPVVSEGEAFVLRPASAIRQFNN